MRQVGLSDQLYQEMQHRAAEAGFASVDGFVADVLSHEFQLAAVQPDHFFTPARLALIDQSAAEVAPGISYTAQQAKDALAHSRNAWLSNHQAGGK